MDTCGECVYKTVYGEYVYKTLYCVNKKKKGVLQF